MSDTRHDPGAAGLPDRSLFSRIAQTPLIDVLRGRLSCRLDMQTVFNRAHLPAPIADHIRLVAKRTRLWRVERVEVAAELAAHFADGLEAGRSPEELLKSFGDPRQAAALIRRAKRRGRHWSWRVLVRTVQGLELLFGLCFLLYGALALRYFSGSPTIAHNYTAELNARVLAVPEAQRAWPVYRRAYLAMPRMPEAVRKNFPGIKEADPAWGEAAAYIKACEPAINLMREGAAKPELGFLLGTATDPELDAHQAYLAGVEYKPLEWQWPTNSDNQMLIQVLLPDLGYLRSFARHLAFDARAAAVAGDPARAAADLHAIYAIAAQLHGRQFLIGDLVALTIQDQADWTLAHLLADLPSALADQQLVALAHQIASLGGGGRVRITFESERLFFEDAVQRAYTDDGRGDGYLTAAGWKHLTHFVGADQRPTRYYTNLENAAAPMGCAIAASRRELMATYNRMLDAAIGAQHTPPWERAGADLDAEVERQKMAPLGDFRMSLIGILMPALGKAVQTGDRATTARDAMLVTIALELYRRHAGQYPALLDEMVPSYLPAVPPDRFDGKPIRYRLVNGRPIVYSVGTNRVDDGGRPPRYVGWDASQWYPVDFARTNVVSPGGMNPIPDGDWVLWPPVRYDDQTGELIGAAGSPTN